MPTDNLNAFNKTQMKIMEHDDLDKFMNMINKNKPSALQVMKDEIVEDENNHFIVENRKLREVLDECLQWLENAPFDYSNGNVAQGIDEGEYYGGRGHAALVEKMKQVLGYT